MDYKIVQDREHIREEQSRNVMPLIGQLLDAWDELPNDVKSDPELNRLAKNIQRIDTAMEEEDAPEGNFGPARI